MHFLSDAAIVYNVYSSVMFVVIHTGGKVMLSGQLRKLPTLCGIVMDQCPHSELYLFVAKWSPPVYFIFVSIAVCMYM